MCVCVCVCLCDVAGDLNVVSCSVVTKEVNQQVSHKKEFKFIFNCYMSFGPKSQKRSGVFRLS